MSLMEQYSDIYGIDIKEVKEWINNYASAKNIPDGMEIEPTKELRIAGIKQYIQSQVDDSVTGRVKASILESRMALSEVKVDVQVCPF